MTTCVIGLGKIGLPLAVQIASKGERVIGADINENVVSLINEGKPPFPGEKNLEEFLAQAIADGTFEATTQTTNAVKQSDNIIVVVPVIVDENANPNFASIDAATEDISKAIQPGTLICYETTLPIGTTRDRFAQMILKQTGMEPGEDIFIAYSPERVFSGRIFADLRAYPKLVGGIDDASTERAINFYESVLDFDERSDLPIPNGVWNLGTSESAEMAKLVETTYRNVNIGLANEFALHAEQLGIDIGPIISASNSQPFSHVHKPGVAVGGHCIPVYPKFYLSTHQEASLPKSAIALNESMPDQAIERLTKAFSDGITDKKIAILGVSYRGGVKETAFSGVFELVKAIESRKGKAYVHDPLYSDQELLDLGFRPFQFGEECDAAIIQADHDIYLDLESSDFPTAQFLYDGRRMLSSEKLGPIKLIQLGTGSKS